MSLVVLLLFFGLLGQACENLNNVSCSASSTVTPHNVSASDTTIMEKAQTINSVLRQWPVANRTEIKIIRRGPYVFARQFWYPSLEIALKKPQPTSPAFTMAITPTQSNTAQPFTSILPASSIAQTITSGPPTSYTTKTTISTTNIIQTNTTKKKTTSRQLSPSTEPTTLTVPPTIITPVTTDLQLTTTESGQLTIATKSRLSTDTSTTSRKITFTPASPDTSFAQTSPVASGMTELATTAIPETVEGPVIPTSPVATATGTTKVTTTALPKTDTDKTVKTTMQEVTTETADSAATTRSTGVSSAFPATASGTDSSASIAHTTLEEQSTFASITANESGTSTAATVINEPETHATKTTQAEGSTTVFTVTQEPATQVDTTFKESNTEGSTNAPTIATDSGTSTSASVKNESKTTPVEGSSTTDSATQVSVNPPTEAHASEGPTTVFTVTQEPATQVDTTFKESNTEGSTNAPTIATDSATSTPASVKNESKTTPVEGSSPAINSEETTTWLATASTLPKSSTSAPDLSHVTMEPSPDKTDFATQVSVNPPTEAHASEGPITVIKITQEPATQADNDNASTAHITFNESSTNKSTNATTAASAPGTNTSANGIIETQTNATKATPVEGSSVTNSSTKGTRTTTTGLGKVSTLPKNPTVVPQLPQVTTKLAPAKSESPIQVVPTASNPHASATTVKKDLFTAPPSFDEGGILLIFSLNDTFEIAFKTRTTPTFLILANKVVYMINKLYGEKFKTFKRSRVNSFSKGSIIVDMTLVFENTSVVPSVPEVEAVLYNAVEVDNPLKVIIGTIKAEPIASTTAPTTPIHANIENTTMNLAAVTGQTSTTSAASAWMLHYSIVAITAIIIVFVTQAQQI